MQHEHVQDVSGERRRTPRKTGCVRDDDDQLKSETSDVLDVYVVSRRGPWLRFDDHYVLMEINLCS